MTDEQFLFISLYAHLPRWASARSRARRRRQKTRRSTHALKTILAILGRKGAP